MIRFGLVLIGVLTLVVMLAAPPPDAGRNFAMVIHGGAGAASQPELMEQRRAAMTRAIQAGYAVLKSGGPAMDAVEAAIRVMEDAGLFDSGRGAYYTKEGVPEMDAAIMDGRTLAAGSVASVKHIANPIHLARLVMEKTPHVLLVGEGAEAFAKSQGIELVSPYISTRSGSGIASKRRKRLGIRRKRPRCGGMRSTARWARWRWIRPAIWRRERRRAELF
jgi:isoaspartyl peptidase/L-asparaginase-like protein (Ntn-hydrolase superfamily)